MKYRDNSLKNMYLIKHKYNWLKNNTLDIKFCGENQINSLQKGALLAGKLRLDFITSEVQTVFCWLRN